MYQSVNKHQMSLMFIGLLLALLGVLSLPAEAMAQAELVISPSTGTYKIGELFSVLINVNTTGKDINAGSAQINFDNQRLGVISVGYSQSIFKIWTDEPNFSNAAGTIKFSGGVPNPGFTGSSGTIARVTFKPKAIGPAPVVFVSGSVLANDGRGTNIGDTLKGGLYTVVASPQVEPKPKEPKKEVVPEMPATGRTPDTPILTDWPQQLEEGSALTIRGVGFPSGRIMVSFQKGEGDSVTQEVFAGPDGRFTTTYRRNIESGFYRIWARNITTDGVSSAPSEIVTVEVIRPLFFRIGTYAVNFVSIIVTVLALLLLAIVLLIWSWIHFRRWQQHQGREISEAEKALHHGFDKLKEGLSAYVGYLTDVRSAGEGKKRAEMTRKELKEELQDIEQDIEKEVEDIKKKRL